METTVKLKALFVIANAGYTDALMDILRAEGASGATVMNARGEGAKQQSILGITVESEKEIIFTIVEASAAKRMMTALKEKAGWKSKLHGICFTMPVDQVIGINAVAAEKLEQPER